MSKIEKTLYLCGSINGCTDEQCNGWREHVKKLWGGPTLDPMRRDYRGDELERYKEIVELDKIDVAAADAVIVSYIAPSVGTSMEILYAFQKGKPIALVCSDARMRQLSPWLRYHCHAIFDRYDDAIKWLAASS